LIASHVNVYAVDKLISEARRLAADYRRATGKTLAISNEIAKHDACELLALEAVDDQHAGGYDAIGREGQLAGQRLQIKARAIFDERKGGQRIGQLKFDKAWDGVVLVIMDENFEAVEMHLASREEIEADSAEHNSKRSKRGAMSVSKFRNIGRLVWTREEGLVEDAVWDNHLTP
jgi:hypothetical protein